MTETVGYPGPAGSHTGTAASVLAPNGSTTIALPSFTAVIEAATAAEVTLGVLPIENSLIGPIAETHDLLYGAPLSIVREATLPIRHSVLGLPGAKLENVTAVWSHPAAFDQHGPSERSGERHLPGPTGEGDDAEREINQAAHAFYRARSGPDWQLLSSEKEVELIAIFRL